MRALGLGMGLVMLMVALSACDQTGGSSSDTAARKRLSANVSYAEFGNYVVHINGMTTTSLTPEVAKAYGIVRSNNRGLVNLVILESSDGPGVSMPVTGQVSVAAANLTGQAKPVKLQEIIDGESIYYLGEVSVDDRETINFDFDIRVEGSNRNLGVRFTHQFYTR